MKKTIILLLTVLSVISANAQLKVRQNGHVIIGPTNPTNTPLLLVRDSAGTSARGIEASINAVSNSTNVAISGGVSSNSSMSSESNFGVFGSVSLNPNHGRNFGVSGMLSWNNTNFYGGAGVYATDYTYMFSFPNNLQGLYAAYFNGTTNLQGRTMAQEIYTPADNNLSENVEPVATRGGEGMLDNLLKMNVREFNMKSSQSVEEPKNLDDMTDEIRQSYDYYKKDQEKLFSRRHFGLSAQELKEIYPNLVLEAQDGYLYVNYTELVPVLIRAIQELKSELDEVKGIKDSSGARKAPSATAVNSLEKSSNILYQNTPNPFKEKTTIRFSLADDAQSASICIFDMTGKMLKTLPVSSGETSVSLNGWELGEGMFLYTLIVGGKEIDTKRMIITK